MMQLNKTRKWEINIILALFSVAMIYLHLFHEDVLKWLCREDGLFEWMSALLYFAASLFFLSIFLKSKYKNILSLLFALLFFVIFGEEISWGQRVFEIVTPDYFSANNVQQEMNLHNIEGVHGSIRFIALLVVISICYLIPLSNHFFRFFNNFFRTIKMPVFPLWMTPIPTAAILFMVVPRLVFNEISFNLDEVGELLLSVGFFLFAMMEYRKTLNGQNS